MSGRPAPASEVIEVWVSKSTYRVRPAASTTRRSCVSPHTPRVRAGAQCARERLGRHSQRLIGLVGASQLLGEGAELRVTIAFEFVDLGLHRVQRLLHGREGAQHGLLATLALFARGLVAARLGGEFAVEQLLVVELRLNALPGGLGGGESRAQLGVLARSCGRRCGRCPSTQPASAPRARQPMTTPERMSASMRYRMPGATDIRGAPRRGIRGLVRRAPAASGDGERDRRGPRAIVICDTRTAAASASASMSSAPTRRAASIMMWAQATASAVAL